MNRAARRARARAARHNRPPHRQAILRTTAEVLIGQRKPDKQLTDLIAETFKADVIYVATRCPSCLEIMADKHSVNTVCRLQLRTGLSVVYAQCSACTALTFEGDDSPTHNAGVYLEEAIRTLTSPEKSVQA